MIKTVPRAYCHVFDTAIGLCAVAWTSRGLSRVLLPNPHLDRELSHFTRTSRPPAAMRTLVKRIVRHLEGLPQDFTDIVLDVDHLGDFDRAVYACAQRVSNKQICTYGDLARAIGKPGAARAVGQALGRNPLPIVVPCHRVLAAGGKAGGFSAFGGVQTKQRLLALEGLARLDGVSQPRNGFTTLWDEGALDTAVAYLRKSDATLERLIDRVGHCTISREEHDVFTALCRSIIYQQLAGKAAAAINGRFLQLFGGSPSAATVLAADDERIRSVGLSAGKVRALRAVADAVANGRVMLDRVPSMSDHEIERHLVGVKGIGPWTVQMLLIFNLGRTDVFPTADLGIRKAFQRLYGGDELPHTTQMEPRAAMWKPWRTVAAWYLWRSLGTVTMK